MSNHLYFGLKHELNRAHATQKKVNSRHKPKFSPYWLILAVLISPTLVVLLFAFPFILTLNGSDAIASGLVILAALMGLATGPICAHLTITRVIEPGRGEVLLFLVLTLLYMTASFFMIFLGCAAVSTIKR